jgi:hypothetical protein
LKHAPNKLNFAYCCSDFDAVNDNEDDGEPARKMTKAKRQSLVDTLKSATVGFNEIKFIKTIAFVAFSGKSLQTQHR